MKIGITGHQKREGLDWEWTKKELKSSISNYKNDVIGLTSLAEGTDQIFGEIILGVGGKLWAIIPTEDYENYFKGQSLITYRRLLKNSEKVIHLSKKETDELSFLSAGKYIVKKSDLLISVWDGNESKGVGGTGDIEKFAKSFGCPILNINPIEKTKENLNG